MYRRDYCCIRITIPISYGGSWIKANVNALWLWSIIKYKFTMKYFKFLFSYLYPIRKLHPSSFWITAGLQTNTSFRHFDCWTKVQWTWLLQYLEDSIVCWRQPNLYSNYLLVCVKRLKFLSTDNNNIAAGPMTIFIQTFMFRQTKDFLENLSNIKNLPLMCRGGGGWVVKLLACGARGPGFDSLPRHLNFRDWLSPASKPRYGWNTAKAT